MSSGPTALQEEGVSFLVVSQKTDGPLSVPELERRGLVLALAVRPLDLQDYVARRDDVGDVSADEGLFEVETPLFGARLDELRQAIEPALV
jgi:hypothetical protein